MRTLFPLLTTAAFLLLGFYFYIVIGGMISPKPIFIIPPTENVQSKPKPQPTYSKQSLAGFPEGTSLAEGESLFKANCASCHHPIRALTGPAIGEAWDKFSDDREFLYAWVRNSPQMIADANPKAIELSNWGPSIMLAFPSLSDDQIASILAYAKTKANEPSIPVTMVSGTPLGQ